MLVDWKGGQAVSVGRTATTELFLTEAGHLLEQDDIENCLFESATGIVKRIETEAMLLWTGEKRQFCQAVVAGDVAERLAKELALTYVDEPSDAVRTWFANDSFTLQTHFSVMTGERATAIFATTEEKLKAALALV